MSAKEATEVLAVGEYNILELGLHLDMVKTIKMLYGRDTAEYYFLKHLPSMQDTLYTDSSASVQKQEKSI